MGKESLNMFFWFLFMFLCAGKQYIPNVVFQLLKCLCEINKNSKPGVIQT